MHRRDFWVGIPEFARDMKLIFICFVLLTQVVLLLCFCYSLVQFDLLGGCCTQWDPPDVLNLSPTAFFFSHTMFFF